MLRHAGYLIPESVRAKVSVPGALRLHGDAGHLPWELALPYQIVARESALPALKSSLSEAPSALWAGATHPGVFPWSKAEAEACGKGWGGRTVGDSGKGLLTDAKAGAGYLVAGLSPGGELVLEDVTANLATWVPRQTQKARTVCRFLFLHLVDHNVSHPYRRADQVARAMLELGVETVIVTLWQPSLAPLPAAVQRFFMRLREGTVAEAFGALRDSFPVNDGRLSRWAFGLYGNPDLRGPELVPLRVGSKLSATTIPRFGKADYRLKITAGPEAGREVPVFSHTLAPGQRLVVGRPGLKRCQIEVNDNILADEAFAFEWEGVEAYLVNLSGSPEKVTVDGLPVHGRLHLKGSQTIRCGSSEFVFAPLGPSGAPRGAAPSAPAAEPPAARERYRLVVANGMEQDQGRAHAVGPASTVVGREGAFVLHDPAVSREHLVIFQRDGVYFANHMGGADVILNGVPVEEESELRHGDRLVLSSTTTLIFSDRTRESAT